MNSLPVPSASVASVPVRCPMGYTRVSDPDVAANIMASEAFAPDNALIAVEPLRPGALRILARGRFSLPPVLASHSGPQHRVVRKAVARFFAPSKVRGLRENLRGWTRERIAEVSPFSGELGEGLGAGSAVGGSAQGGIDVAREIVRHVPPRAFAELTGIRVPAPEILQPWSLESLELFWGWPDAERQEYLAASAVEFMDWLRGAVKESESLPEEESLFKHVRCAALRAGLPVTEQQLVSLGYFLVIAGQETTSLLINAALERALSGGKPSKDSELSWRDYANPEHAAALADSVLAEESSVPAWRRRARQRIEVNGRTFEEGEDLHVLLSGGGGAASLAFGGGVHRCLGALLAPLEVEVMVSEMARAWPEARLVEVGERLDISSFRAPLQVIVDPGAPRVSGAGRGGAL